MRMPITKILNPPDRRLRLLQRRIILITHDKQHQTRRRIRNDQRREPVRFVEQLVRFERFGQPDDLHGRVDAGAAAGVGAVAGDSHAAEGVV